MIVEIQVRSLKARSTTAIRLTLVRSGEAGLSLKCENDRFRALPRRPDAARVHPSATARRSRRKGASGPLTAIPFLAHASGWSGRLSSGHSLKPAQGDGELRRFCPGVANGRDRQRHASAPAVHCKGAGRYASGRDDAQRYEFGDAGGVAQLFEDRRRWCAGYKVESADGVFQIREDAPTPRTLPTLRRTP